MDIELEAPAPEPTVTEAPQGAPAPVHKRGYCKNCGRDIYVFVGEPELCTNCNS